MYQVIWFPYAMVSSAGVCAKPHASGTALACRAHYEAIPHTTSPNLAYGRAPAVTASSPAYGQGGPTAAVRCCPASINGLDRQAAACSRKARLLPPPLAMPMPKLPRTGVRCCLSNDHGQAAPVAATSPVVDQANPCHQCQVLTATTKQSMARFPPLLLALPPTPKLLPTAGGCWYCSAQDVGQAPSTATSPTGRRPSPCHQRQALAATRRQQCSRRRPYTLPCRRPSYNRDRMLPIPGLATAWLQPPPTALPTAKSLAQDRVRLHLAAARRQQGSRHRPLPCRHPSC